MREILFRGKRVDNGEWIEGHYGEYMLMSGASIPCISIPNKEAVCGSICYDVEASTVGQYTGLNDQNGNKIFEGDIIKFSNGSCFIVEQKYNLCSVKYRNLNNYPSLFNDKIDGIVIGNIHDNPELLEVEE